MANLTSGAALTFRDISFDVVAQDGAPWLRGLQIASALGYRNPATDIVNLFDRNADEFTESMTALLKLPTAGGPQEVRIFSLRGAHLLGMLARTERAKEFRAWVLDVLEHQPAPAALPAAAPAVAELEYLHRQVRVLRELARPQLLRENPRWRKVIRLHAIEGLTHEEKAKLIGVGADTWRKLLAKLDALGLLEYKPNPGQSQGARAARMRQIEAGNGVPNGSHEHMRRMREASAAKRAARQAGQSLPAGENDDGR